MRLIDADALLNRMQEDPLFDLVERYGVSGVIEAEPTVDAVPVIRCKDCKHQEKYFHADRRRKDGGYNIYWCDLVDGYAPLGFDDDFCSRAERKEE